MKNSPLLTIVVAVLALSLALLLTLWGIGLLTKQNILGNLTASFFPTDTSAPADYPGSDQSPTAEASDPTPKLNQDQPSSSPASSLVPDTRPTPTPTPTGPGPYACSPQGVCSNYEGVEEKNGCPRTYADTACLGQCGDAAKQCKI